VKDCHRSAAVCTKSRNHTVQGIASGEFSVFGRTSNTNVAAEPKVVEPMTRPGGPPPVEARPSSEGLSVIGRELSISGEGLRIVTRGGIRIDGEIFGDLYGAEVVIGESGRVRGTVVGERISIDGWVEGSVHGLRIELLKRAHVEGEIHHQTIKMEEGAFIEGSLRRVSDEDLRAAMAAASRTPEA
jgi:cytoskeletal protein CcmA (bactofilin family)